MVILIESRLELNRGSQVSSGSTQSPVSAVSRKPSKPTKRLPSQKTRIRKSFSLNDMKQFLAETRKDEITLLDSRNPEPVIHTGKNLLRPLKIQNQTKIQTSSITTPSLSPSSSTKENFKKIEK